MGGGNEEGVLLNEKPNQGVKERGKFGVHLSNRSSPEKTQQSVLQPSSWS
jgi:hypothetical protein